MNLLEIQSVRKAFGSQTVLDDVSFSVKEHTIFGFIGENGAGKTTTMKAILGLLHIDDGEILVCGEKVKYGNTHTNQYIGYLPDVPEFYGYMTPLEYLDLCGHITGMSQQKIQEKSIELISLVGLTSYQNKKISGFSRGMKQRLGIAQALLNEPRLLICDEPTSALDPIGRKEILDILKKVKNKTTVIFSTHILSDVERICDEIAILHQGHIVLNGTLEEIKARHMVDSLLIEVYHPQDMKQIKEAFSQYQITSENDRQIIIHDHHIYDLQLDIFKYLATHHIQTEKIMIQEPTLENLFMEVVQ